MPVPLNLAYDERYVQFDYESRTDERPIYQGMAAMDTDDGASAWTIKKYTYDANNQCTKIRIVYKKDWTNRASHFA